MKAINTMITTLFLLLILSVTSFAKGWSNQADPEFSQKENVERTKLLLDKVEAYLESKNAYVGIIARRGAGDPTTGVSDTDNLDLSGMAHCGFVIRNNFGPNPGYSTFNLVRMKGAKKTHNKTYDLSELRVWSLPHFFIGSFEKDAIVFLPPKKVQLKLWNLLRAYGQLEIMEKKRLVNSHSNGENQSRRYVTDKIIANGAFTLFHNPEYNLLSDFVEESTQNCNEHLLKTYVAIKDFWNPQENNYSLTNLNAAQSNRLASQTSQLLEQRYTPRQMVLSRTKSTFAFTQNIRFGERHSTSPTFFGLKINKEKFEVASVDSFCSPDNQSVLGWEDFKVFREAYTKTRGWHIVDKGKDYVKVNRFTGKPNSIKSS